MIIQARGLEKIYRRGAQQVAALRGVDLDLQAGEFAVILGPSGGGKSTLLHVLGGIDRPSAGQVRVNGFALESASESALTRFRRDHIGFIFQFYNLLPSLSALDNVLLSLLAKGWGWQAARQHGLEMLAQVGLAHRSGHRPAELSGGEQQRVAIARALSVDPALVLADEPTGDLDSATANELLELMADLNRSLGKTFIIATHNQETCRFATSLFEMRDGRLSPKGMS